MITINKKNILLFAMISISWLAKAPTITIPHETVQSPDISLFLLVQDQYGEHRTGIFEIDPNEQIKTISNDDFQSVDDATLSLEGEEVAFFDFYDSSMMNKNIIYFEIDANVKVIKALIINNSLLAEHVFSVVDMQVEMDDDFLFDSLDDDLFGDINEQQEAMGSRNPIAQKSYSASQMLSIAKIVVLVQYEKVKKFGTELNSKAKRFARWLDGSGQL